MSNNYLIKACEDVNDSPGDVILEFRGTSLPSTSSTSIPYRSFRWVRRVACSCFLSGNELKENITVRVQEQFGDLRALDGNVRVAQFYPISK